MNTLSLLSPKDQLENHVMHMTLFEKKFVLCEIENNMQSMKIPILHKIIFATQKLFFMTCLENKTLSKNSEDRVKTLEEIIFNFSPVFLSYIVHLEFGSNLIHGIGPLSRIPSNIGLIRNLKKLFLNDQSIEDFGPLKELKLDFLCAEGCPVANPHILNVEYLTWYNLRKTSITNISFLQNQKLIGSQVLENTTNLSLEEAFIVLETMPYLTDFYVGKKNISLYPKNAEMFVHERDGHYRLKYPEEEKNRNILRKKFRQQRDDYFLCYIL